MTFEKNAHKLTTTLCVLVSMSGVALAGIRSNVLVTIDDNAKVAQGALGASFNSNDNNQYIGCYTFSGHGMCFAQNAAGVTRTCATSDAENIAVIRSLSGDALLRFEWDDAGNCRPGGISVAHWSYSRPKKPTL
jgi:hypothetical protein